jgi:L-cystine uptake protein TcyP (sodium:dicarboxylate symporter family)
MNNGIVSSLGAAATAGSAAYCALTGKDPLLVSGLVLIATLLALGAIRDMMRAVNKG